MIKSLTCAKTGPVDKVPADFVEKLEWLLRFGQPRLSFITDGWHANIKMHVGAVGAEFTIKSDFNHQSPIAALDVCIERMLDALVLLNRKE